MRFLSRLLGKHHGREEASAAAPTASPSPAARAPAAPPATAAARKTVEEPTTVESAIELFGTIQEAIATSAEAVHLPAAALLRNLPPELRGPDWMPDGQDGSVTIALDREELLGQLRRGRVIYPLADLVAGLPRGWVKHDPDALVELGLADVVQALPPELLHGATQASEDVVATAGMRDYFRPAGETAPAPDAAAPPGGGAHAARRGAVSRTKKPRPRIPLPPGAWDGVDRGADAGPLAVDVNAAAESELARVPGLGAARARALVAHRAEHGPFAGIHELLDVPGIGRKVFRRTTGLETAPTRRRDRHETLNALLGLPAGERPSLPRIVEVLASRLGLAGCALGGADGMVLAQSPGTGEEADRWAAILPRWYRRSRSYLRRLGGGGTELIVFASRPAPVWVAVSPYFHLVGIGGAPDGGALERARKVVDELDWLMRPRLVARAVS